MAFLKTFKKCLKEIRNTSGFAQGLADYAQSQAFMTDFAYLDSTDISTWYVTQPSIQAGVPVAPAPAPAPAPVPASYAPAGPADYGVPTGVPIAPPVGPAPPAYDPSTGAYPSPLPPPGSANPYIDEPMYAPAPSSQPPQYG